MAYYSHLDVLYTEYIVLSKLSVMRVLAENKVPSVNNFIHGSCKTKTCRHTYAAIIT